MKHSGKVIGITGAGSVQGIGFAIAKKLCEQGAKVFICDLNEQALKKAKEELSKIGKVRTFVVDVSNEKQIQDMFKQVMEYYGKCDVFINNAGIYPQSYLIDMSTKDFEKTISVNLKSVFICSKEAFKCMKNKGGVIIQAASYAALIPSAGSGAYAASKAAVYSLTKTMAAEFAPYGIRVNGFIPGVIATSMTQGVIDEKGPELNQAIALQKLGTPEDVANAVSFLASDESSYITGTFIEISGGKLCVQNPHAPWMKKGA